MRDITEPFLTVGLLPPNRRHAIIINYRICGRLQGFFGASRSTSGRLVAFSSTNTSSG